MIQGMVAAPVARAMVCAGAEIVRRLDEAGDALLIDRHGHGASSRKIAPLPAVLSLVEMAG